MKQIIIIMNVLLISLILYNLFSKSAKIIEGLKGCSKDKTSKVYKHEAQIEKLFSDIENINDKTNKYDKKIKLNSKNILKNKIEIKSVGNDIKNKAKNFEKGLPEDF